MTESHPSAILLRHSIRPNKAFGQHFLINDAVADRIVDAVRITPDATVLEIGAGTGILTRRLVVAAGRVIAVEIDRQMGPILEEALAGYAGFSLLQHDILDVDLASVCRENGVSDLVVIGNLPYNITGPVIERLMKFRRVIRHAVVMVQAEVGQRLCAAPGSKVYGAVTVLLQYVYHARMLFRVAAGNFHPPPAVQSVVIELQPYAVPPVDVHDEQAFRRLVKAAFVHRRKMLHHAIARLTDIGADDISARTGIDLKRRAETLSLEEFARLANIIFPA